MTPAGCFWGWLRHLDLKQITAERDVPLCFFCLTYLELLCIISIEILGINFHRRYMMKKKQNMEHTQLLVLSLLANEDMYGYQMILELARRSDHTFEMKEGTLYPVLHGLEKDGLVEAYQQEAPTGRMRKYYHLTRKGGAALKTETEVWKTYSNAVNAVLEASLGISMA